MHSTSLSGPSPSGSSTPEAGGISKAKVDEALEKIDGVVEAEMKATGVPGVAVAVVYRDTMVFAEGYGVRRLGNPEKVGADTVFQIASMSKPVSSTAVAALVGKKKFGWDDPVRKYLPDLTFSEAYVTDHVTFADLYSHRSGLPGNTGNRLEEIGFTRDQILQRLRYVPLNPFRATYSYSNFGMTAAGQAAAAADQTTFEDLMQQQLFGPAGMTSTSARYSDFVSRPDRTSLHIRIDGNWQLGPERDPDAQAPAGGISSSVTDLAKWMRLQLSGGTLDGEPIVAKDALIQTHTPHILRAPLSKPDAPAAMYGLGWNIDVDHLGYVRWSHSGAFSVGAATTTVLLPKASLGVVVLTNGAPIGAAEAMADDIIDDVVNGTPTRNWGKFWGDIFAQIFLPDPELAQPPADATPAKPASAYVGAYSNPYHGTFDVRADAQGGLTITQGPKRLVFPMTHWNADTFTYVESPETPDFRAALTFTLGSDGKAATLDVGGMPGVNILRRTG